MSVRQSTRIGIAATAVIGALASLSMPAAAHAAADHSPTVTHNEVETVHYTDDICGPRENDTTYTRKVVVERIVDAGDGSFWYHYTARVNYVSDFVDPSIPDARGSLTEVINFNLTPGATFTGTGTYHEYLGDDIRIYERFHLTVVDGEPVVDRFISGFEGCP
ncbi:hypothetical protein [Agromyces albus]|uniref:hypothetical protein n=1 Tax=Agromyces albus TaxID=205332 RepID=UPI00277D71C7|nr:hypothetical protein [Agromyces albus]MDQ0576796.1 hypothetical protein [Agromyces albus]